MDAERFNDSVRRIRKMSFDDVYGMSAESVARLTGDFSESLVRLLFTKAETKVRRGWLYEKFEKDYSFWFNSQQWYDQRELPHMPPYFKDIKFDIECNLPIEPLPETMPPVEPFVTGNEFIAIEPPKMPVQADCTERDESHDEALEQELSRLKEAYEEVEEQLEMVREREKGISPGINQGQVALLGLSLANVMGFNYTNKKHLAPLLHGLFGWGEAKLAKCLGSVPCEKEARDELANMFKDLCPLLHRTIMNWGELPPEVTPLVTP